jgi:(2Fe-2S) ferredoxin
MGTWDLTGTKHHVYICNGGSCMLKHAEEVTQAIRAEIAKQGADHLIHTTRTQCQGRCEDSCVVTVYPDGIWYKEVMPKLSHLIVSQHLMGGNPLFEQISYTYDQALVASGLSALGVSKK